ncbi:hypothetical protein SELMODRAFT_422537 [Selaginella moellendorffii]|uniref:Uncharacterized protein n=1 Tax=Selaginella moellendorffii TaxID=88036 RepID=D8SIR6_SELML|nr:hypothetical protein SELMODRAFT_422537 [Selaginella moellendorffii]
MDAGGLIWGAGGAIQTRRAPVGNDSRDVFRDLIYTERPFWRKTRLSTSNMVAAIAGFRERYEAMPGLHRRWGEAYGSIQGLAQFLFQANRIEQQGYESFDLTLDAVRGGKHLATARHDDRRAEAMRCLNLALASVIDQKIPRFSVEGIALAHETLLATSKPEIAGRIRDEDAFTRTSVGYWRMFRRPASVAAELAELVRDCNLSLAGIFRDIDRDGEDDGVDPPFVDRENYIHCFERADHLGDKVDTLYNLPVFYSDKLGSPDDLTAMIAEGIYVSWKRFFRAMEEASTSTEE